MGVVDARDRLTGWAGASISYDRAGRLDKRVEGSDVADFDYDALGNLDRVELPGGRVVEYVWDGLGRRVGRRVDGELVAGWLYGGGLSPVAELRPDGSVRSRFVSATRGNVPDFMVRDGRTYRLVTDYLGSQRLVIDTQSGEVAQRLEFDEFGRTIADSNPGFQPFGYAGGLQDPDTGLVRFGARDYDPDTARWTAPDPIGFHGGDTNLYGYVLQDPINHIDPEGLWPDRYGAGNWSGGPGSEHNQLKKWVDRGLSG